jgi:mannose-1-phosphate guanylyltransferase
MPELMGMAGMPNAWTPSDVGARGSLWAIVLAGGQGARLRSLTRHVHGDDRPKQFAVLSGNRSLLRQTLDRVALLIPVERTVVATMAEHRGYVAAELGVAGGGPWVLSQPEDRGTAAALLLAAHWIQARDNKAMIAVFPSDHFVLEERAFMGHVEAIAAFIQRRSDYTVLLGAQPTEPETDYGWVEPGERVGWARRDPIYRVRSFREKPSPAEARSLFAAGALWNTLVFIARAASLIEAGRERVPVLERRLHRATVFAGTDHERWALRQAYALAPAANFSRSMLEVWPLPLGICTLSAINWCDLGAPARVVKMLSDVGVTPAWAATLPWPALPVAK